MSGGETPLLTLPHTGFPELSLLSPLPPAIADDPARWGCMTFPACGSCGAAGAGAAVVDVFGFAFAGEGDGVADGLTEEGLDQPGPVVVEA